MPADNTTSSGRLDIWRGALEVMFEHPLSLLTGFGWRAYFSMPFRFAPHNYYLNLWFNLGLVGLACGLVLLALPIRTAKNALRQASGAIRPVLMGFVVATIALAVATFFVDLFLPWLYFWAYSGIVMRLALNALQPATSPVAANVARAPRSPPRNVFGWRGTLHASTPARSDADPQVGRHSGRSFRQQAGSSR